MKTRYTLHCQLLIILLLIFPWEGMQAQKNKNKQTYSVIESSYNVMTDRKFDIEYYEKNKERASLSYTKSDSTKIWQYESGFNTYIEREVPPAPKLYTYYREYYLSGNLKKEGLELGKMSIGIYREYDEEGNEIRTQDMDELQQLPKKFDYNKVMLLFDSMGRIDIKTGRGREDFSLHHEKDTNRWIITFRPVDPKISSKGKRYEVDANSGKIKKEYDYIFN